MTDFEVLEDKIDAEIINDNEADNPVTTDATPKKAEGVSRAGSVANRTSSSVVSPYIANAIEAQRARTVAGTPRLAVDSSQLHKSPVDSD